MIAIHSFFKNTNDIRSNIELVANQALLSFKFLKKHKFTTILYTDKFSINYFKHIKYDNIIILDIPSIIPNIPIDFWSASKLISCFVTNEPYFHIDTDLFLIENCLEKFLNQDFFILHNESWIKNKGYHNHFIKINKYFNYIDMDSLAYNNAIFGGQKYNIINEQISVLMDSIIINNNIIDEILFDKKNESKKSVFIEQYLFDNLVKKELKMSKIPLIIEESLQAQNTYEIYQLLKKYNILHLWINKNTINNVIGINNLLDMLDRKYF